MTQAQAYALHSGDQVQWTDPDAGLCSRIVTIQTIEHPEPGVVRITEPDGSVLECLIRELH
jgi:hypothetical protein